MRQRHRIRVRTVLAFLSMNLLLAASCGSSGSSEPAASDGVGGTSSTAVTASDTEVGGAPGDSSPGDTAPPTTVTGGVDEGSSDAGASDTTGSGAPSANATPISAELAHECVRPGGTQTITITTEPNAAVGYETRYADGSEGHDGRGGSAMGFADPSGRWSDTWTVAPTAPGGPVGVAVFAMGFTTDSGSTAVTFDVSDAAGTCH